MTRPHRRLRTRLLVAMMAIALGVLVLTAAVTAGLRAPHRDRRSARHDVQHTPVVADEFDPLIEQLPPRAPPQTRGRAPAAPPHPHLVHTTLSASDGAVVAIDADGNVREFLAACWGRRERGHVAQWRERRRPRHHRPAVARPTPLTAPARPQPSSRLDLGEPAAPPTPAPPAPESRFARGLLLALVLAALALAAYVWRDPIASRSPRPVRRSPSTARPSTAGATGSRSRSAGSGAGRTPT